MMTRTKETNRISLRKKKTQRSLENRTNVEDGGLSAPAESSAWHTRRRLLHSA
jgi:hypothetical protein